MPKEEGLESPPKPLSMAAPSHQGSRGAKNPHPTSSALDGTCKPGSQTEAPTRSALISDTVCLYSMPGARNTVHHKDPQTCPHGAHASRGRAGP